MNTQQKKDLIEGRSTIRIVANSLFSTTNTASFIGIQRRGDTIIISDTSTNSKYICIKSDIDMLDLFDACVTNSYFHHLDDTSEITVNDKNNRISIFARHKLENGTYATYDCIEKHTYILGAMIIQKRISDSVVIHKFDDDILFKVNTNDYDRVKFKKVAFWEDGIGLYIKKKEILTVQRSAIKTSKDSIGSTVTPCAKFTVHLDNEENDTFVGFLIAPAGENEDLLPSITKEISDLSKDDKLEYVVKSMQHRTDKYKIIITYNELIVIHLM